MALDPLATIADLEARGVTVDPSETAVVGTYLDVASSLIRQAAGSTISAVESTITLEGRGGRLPLPGQPVTAVSAVSVNGVAVTDYKLLSGWLAAPCGFHTADLVTITYTHGLPNVPADIIDLACRLAGQALAAYRSGDPTPRAVTSERIGDYSVTYADTDTGNMTLSDSQVSRLAARFGSGGGVTVRSI
jgi:hypothetical protein